MFSRHRILRRTEQLEWIEPAGQFCSVQRIGDNECVTGIKELEIDNGGS